MEPAVAGPIEMGLMHHSARHERGAVDIAALIRTFVEFVGKSGLVPPHRPVNRLGVWIEQQLGRIAALAVFRVPGPVHPIGVKLTGFHGRKVTVPAITGHLGQVDARFIVVVIEQAQFHTLGTLGKQGKVRSRAVINGSQRIGLPGPDFHLRFPSAQQDEMIGKK